MYGFDNIYRGLGDYTQAQNSAGAGGTPPDRPFARFFERFMNIDAGWESPFAQIFRQSKQGEAPMTLPGRLPFNPTTRRPDNTQTPINPAPSAPQWTPPMIPPNGYSMGQEPSSIGIPGSSNPYSPQRPTVMPGYPQIGGTDKPAFALDAPGFGSMMKPPSTQGPLPTGYDTTNR